MAILCLGLLSAWIRCVTPAFWRANVDSRFGKLCLGLGDSELAKFCQQEEEGLRRHPCWYCDRNCVFGPQDSGKCFLRSMPLCCRDSKNFIQTHTGPFSTERVDVILIAHSRGVFRLNLNCFFAACWGLSHLCIFMGLWLTEGGSINHTASHLWQALTFTEISHGLSFCPSQHHWELGVGRHYYTFVRQ